MMCLSKFRKLPFVVPMSIFIIGTRGQKKNIPVPMTTGHEFAGVITELGESVGALPFWSLKVGDVVSAEVI